MKQIIFATVLLVLTTTIISCKKEQDNCELIPAAVIRYDCDRVIFKLLTSEAIGDAQWEDVLTGKKYSNIVSYYNTCAVANLTKGRMDTVYVNLVKTNENLFGTNCVQCLAVSPNPPQTKVDFVELKSTKCND